MKIIDRYGRHLIILVTFAIGIIFRIYILHNGIEDYSFPPNYYDVKADAYRSRISIETKLKGTYLNKIPMNSFEGSPDYEGAKLTPQASAPYPFLAVLYLDLLRILGHRTNSGMFIAFLILEFLVAVLYAFYALKLDAPLLFPLYYLNFYFYIKVIQRPSMTSFGFFAIYLLAYILLSSDRRRFGMFMAGIATGFKLYPIFLLRYFREKGYYIYSITTVTTLLLPFLFLKNYGYIYTFHLHRGLIITKILSLLFAGVAIVEILWLERQKWSDLTEIFPYIPLPLILYSALPTGGLHLFPLLFMLPDRDYLRNILSFFFSIFLTLLYWFHIGLTKVPCSEHGWKISQICYDGGTRYALILISSVISLLIIPIYINLKNRKNSLFKP